MKRSPLRTIRSEWERVEAFERYLDPSLDEAAVFRLRVHDGTLGAIRSVDDGDLHLSVSFRDNRGELSRYPTWDEIAHARDALLPADLTFVMFLPKADEYVALHDTTFHLHEYRGEP